MSDVISVSQKTAKFAKIPHGDARNAAKLLEKSGRIIGMTKGQFSLIDLISALLERVGPSHCVISTWTTGIRDQENAYWLLRTGRILSLKFLTDRSFPSRQYKYAKSMVQRFGSDTIWCTRTHAKFALISNDDGWRVVIRSSMNLNRNPRFEQFDIDDDPNIFAFFQEQVDDICRPERSGISWKTSDIDNEFSKAMRDTGENDTGIDIIDDDIDIISMMDRDIVDIEKLMDVETK